MKELNVFIAGYGRVGKALVAMIRDNAPAIASKTGKSLKVIGLSNSKRYALDPAGLDLSDPQALLESGTPRPYLEALCSLGLPDKLFVDCTADGSISGIYPVLFEHGYSVVACNKKPFSGSSGEFFSLRGKASSCGVSLRYETTAGAALPVLSTIDRVVHSGDELYRIDAVLSGTLNYLCDNYDGSGFDALVEDARLKGYTEPDPRDDLSGRDVLRKILILSRQAGIPLEEGQVNLEPVPSDIDERYRAAASKGCRLRYVASVEAGGRASVGLAEVAPDSPLYSLRGTDNAILITTRDYPSPMLIQGAGAGPRQTAGGLLGDILMV